MHLSDLPFDVFTTIFSYSNIPVQTAIELNATSKFFNQLFKYDFENGHTFTFDHDINFELLMSYADILTEHVKSLNYTKHKDNLINNYFRIPIDIDSGGSHRVYQYKSDKYIDNVIEIE